MRVFNLCNKIFFTVSHITMKNRMESDYNIDYELKMINGRFKNCFVNHIIHGYNYYK